MAQRNVPCETKKSFFSRFSYKVNSFITDVVTLEVTYIRFSDSKLKVIL